MTIREIEEQLGIPRATVRYYEREGLLTPARGGRWAAMTRAVAAGGPVKTRTGAWGA